MKISFIPLTAALCLLTSCKLGRSFERPALSLPEQLSMKQEADDTTTIADLKWWEIYADTTLQVLISRTLENNKDLKVATARVRELAALKRVDRANLFPKLDANVYAEKDASNYGGHNFKNNPEFGAKASVSWELDLWGNIRWAKDRSLAQFMASVEAQRAVKMSLVADVALNYFELVAMDQELRIVRQTLQAREEGVRLAKLRFEGGLTSETPYQQAQLELARTATLIPDLQRRISLKENEIAFLSGEFPQRIERSADYISWQQASLPVGLPSTLLERRPDIREAEQKLVAANAAVGIAYTNLFPRLSLTAQFGLESEEIRDFLKSPMHNLTAKLLSPLFAMGKNRALLKAQKAAYEQECYRYEKTVLQAFKEARNAIVDFNKLEEICASRRRLEQSAKTTMELAQLQYINGVIGYLDVLDAQRSYFDAQISLSNAVRDKQLCLVRLYKSLGGGW